MSLNLDYFFFKRMTADEMRISDWSSGVCTSDLLFMERAAARFRRARMPRPARHWHGSTDLILHEHSLYDNLEKPLPQGHFIMMSWQSRMKMSSLRMNRHLPIRKISMTNSVA